MKPAISLNKIGISYKRKGSLLKPSRYYQALNSVTMDINYGETLGIYGKNGSGKSTLLKVISGVLKPDSGTIINNGVSVSLLALHVGFDQNLNGRENAIIGGMLHGLSRKQATENICKIQEYADLSEFFHEPIRTYSTGMLARLGFAVAITAEPDVLLIDEVLSVGDEDFRTKAEQTIFRRVQSQQSVVIVSHSLPRLKQLCDRIVFIEDGQAKAGEHTTF